MTYYDILGVSKTANCAEIKKAYRELAKKYHPDASHKDTNDKFKRIKEIYEVLVDPNSRKLYDDSIKSNISKLNSQLTNLKISVAESITGCIKSVSYYYTIECNCGTKKIPCNLCKGKGFIRTYGDRIKTCPACEGHKFENTYGCRLCFGSGEIRKFASTDIIVPSGVSDGTILEQDTSNGPISTKIIIERISTDIYDRKGDDLIFRAKIDPITALIGGVIFIPTLNGDIELNIKENSKNENLFKISHLGIPGTEGSLYVQVSIDYNLTNKLLIPKIRSVVNNGK